MKSTITKFVALVIALGSIAACSETNSDRMIPDQDPQSTQPAQPAQPVKPSTKPAVYDSVPWNSVMGEWEVVSVHDLKAGEEPYDHAPGKKDLTSIVINSRSVEFHPDPAGNGPSAPIEIVRVTPAATALYFKLSNGKTYTLSSGSKKLSNWGEAVDGGISYDIRKKPKK